MLICDTDSDSEDVETSMGLSGDKFSIPSGSSVVTRKHSYEPDIVISHPAQHNPSVVESNHTSTLPKEPKTDTATADVNLNSDNPEVPLDFLAKPSLQDYYDDADFGAIYRFLLKDEFGAVRRIIIVCF